MRTILVFLISVMFLNLEAQFNPFTFELDYWPQGVDAVIMDEINDYDYLSNIFPRSYPKGLDIEIFTYDSLTDEIIKQHQIIINCTPIGTFPNINACPNIPFAAINSEHILYDLIYNPEETTFLKFGKDHGATILNGLKMLELQAEKAWSIWDLS